MAKTEQRIVEVVIKGQQANSTLKDIESSARGLRAQLRGLTPGTQEFVDKTKELQNVNKRLNKIKDDVNGVGGMFSKIGKEIKGFGVLAAAYLGFDFITSSIKDIIGQNARLSDSLADIQKTTGMSAKEVENLNRQLSKIGTRTSTEELRKIAIAAGQLGISKNDILGFTAATDKLVVSLGDEFSGGAEEVTKQLGGLRNTFMDIKSDNVSDDMLKIGNAINVLGSSGAATGPVVSDFANRIGGVGITMGLTSGQVLGLSATLQELNVSTERGGTAVVKILQKMTTDTASFAKVAGMPTKEFTQLVNKDLYGAFVKVAEGAKKGGTSATALANIMDKLGVEGAGASEVFAKLGNNTDLLEKRVNLANGALKETNSVMAEFQTKNQTMAGDVEKISKGFSSWFTNSSIANGMKSVTGWLADMFDKTKAVSTSMEEERMNVRLLTEELKSTNASQERRVEIYDELKSINPSIVEGIDRENISMAQLTQNVKAYNEQQIKRIVIQQKQEKIDEAQKIAAEKYQEVLEAEKESLKVFDKIREQSGSTAIKARKILDDETTSYLEKIKALELLGKTEKLMVTNGRRTTNILKDIYAFDQVMQKEGEYQKLVKETTDLINDKNDTQVKIGANLDEAKKKEIDYTKLSNEQLKKYIQDSIESRGNLHRSEAVASKAELERRKQQGTEQVTVDEETHKKLLEARKKYLDSIAKLEEEYKVRNMTADEQEEYRIYKKYEKEIEAAKGNEDQLRLLRIWREDELKHYYQDQYEKNKGHYKSATEEAEAYYKATGKMMQKSAEDNQQMNDIKKAADHEYIQGANVIAEGAALTNEMRMEALFESLKKKMKLVKEYLNEFKQIVDLYNQNEDAKDDIATKRIDKDTKDQLANQKKLLDQKLISENVYNKRVTQIESGAEKRKLDIERAAAKRKKQMAMFDIGINTAVAISEASPNVAKMILAAGIGGIQLALVANKPEPYAEGGSTFKYGGRVNRPHIAIAGEAGREWIAPNWMVESPTYGPTIEALENVRSRGYATGGNTIDTSLSKSTNVSATSTPSFSTGDLVSTINRLNNILDAGVEAKINYDRWERDQANIAAAKR